MLSLLVFLPIIGAIFVLMLPREREMNSRIAAVFATLNLVGSLVVFAGFDRADQSLQFVTQRSWISAAYAGFNVQYFVGVDGLSATMVLLTGILFVVAVLVSWQHHAASARVLRLAARRSRPR